MKPHKHIRSIHRPALHISPGSEAGKQDLLTEQYRCSYGLMDAGQTGSGILLDFSPPHVPAPSGNPELDGENLLSPHRFIRAELPDRASLVAADEAGLLPFMPTEWISNPQAARDNQGAGGDPCVGRVLAVANRPRLHRAVCGIMQRYMDFARKQQLASNGHKDRGDSSRFPCHLHVSLLGGTGNGAMYETIPLINQCAGRQHLETKLIIHTAMLGTLPTLDGQQARLNEITGLKFLQALSTGRYIDPVTGRAMECPISGVILYSNRNNHGGVDSLDRVNRIQALYRFAWENTPAGAKLDERMVDMEQGGPDKLGDPRKGMTQSCSVIHLDQQRVWKFATLRAIGAFVKELLRQADIQATRRKALEFARFMGVVESERENQLTHTVLHPKGLDGESALQRLDAIFSDRTGNNGGMAGAIARKDAVETISSRDFPTLVEPTMIEQARELLAKAMRAITDQVDDMMRHMTGVWQTIGCLQALKHILELAGEALSAKGATLRQELEPHDQALAESVERIEALRQRPMLVRWWHAPAIRQINRVMEQSGRLVLRRRAELRAIEIVQSEILKPMGQFIDRKLAGVIGIQNALLRIGAWASQQADRQAEADSSFWAPLGQELADHEFLESFYANVINAHGGEQKLAEQLLSEFLSRHSTLATLGPLAETEVQTILEQLCSRPFEQAANQLDVLDVFATRYADSHVRQALIRQRLRESSAAVPITGDTSGTGCRVKVAMVPDVHRAAWLVELLETIDEDDSPWQLVGSDDSSCVMFLQVCNHLSLAPFIREAADDEPAFWAQLLRRAPDPVSALMPNIRPSRRQLQHVIIKGLAISQIRYNSKQGFVLALRRDATEAVGQSPDDLLLYLERSYGHVVHIESQFAHHLVIDPGEVAAALDNLADSCPEPLRELVDEHAISTVRQQMRLLEPTLGRIREANARRDRRQQLGVLA